MSISFLSETTLLYVISGKHIGLAKLLQGYRLSNDDGQYISTKTDGKKFIMLKPNETVLQVLSFVSLFFFYADKNDSDNYCNSLSYVIFTLSFMLPVFLFG